MDIIKSIEHEQLKNKDLINNIFLPLDYFVFDKVRIYIPTYDIETNKLYFLKK